MSYYKKQIRIVIGGVVLLLLGTLIFSIYQYRQTDFREYANELRIEVNDVRYEVEQGNYPTCEYPYMVIDLSGTIRYADEEWKYPVGEAVSVEEMLQQDKTFATSYEGYDKKSFVLNDKKNTCIGFIIFLVPKSVIDGRLYTTDLLRCFLPVGIGIAISCVVLILCSSFMGRRVLRPLQRISVSAQAIIGGNYDEEVLRVYDEELKKNEVGELTYSFELMRDELKAKQISEQSLRKSQQELMSCISHDLRTPISTIKAYCEGMRDGVIVDGMSQQDYLAIILEKTNLLEKMIADLLTYSNTQLNKMDIQKKEVYFRDYAVEIAREIHIFVSQYGVKFTCEIMEENMIVQMDVKRITEVLYNLIENSLKYIGEENGEIHLSAQITRGVPSFHVKDNGVGIGAEDIPYVFDKFYRAEKSRSSNIPGSGLGLSICKYIVNQHGGEIFCTSTKSKGSEFWFTLNEY